MIFLDDGEAKSLDHFFLNTGVIWDDGTRPVCCRWFFFRSLKRFRLMLDGHWKSVTSKNQNARVVSSNILLFCFGLRKHDVFFFFESFFSIFGDSGGNCAVFFPDFNLYQKPKDLTVTNDAGHCPEELARQMGQHHLLPLFLGAADMVTLLEKIAGERVNQHFFILRIVVTVVVNFKQLLGCPRTGQQWEN